MGKTGRGTHENHHVIGAIDILTGTLGKALGGASGGYTGRREESSNICASARGRIFLQYAGAAGRSHL